MESEPPPIFNCSAHALTLKNFVRNEITRRKMNMNMKKIASVALAAALSASLLAGCGGSGEGGSDSVTLKIGDNWGATQSHGRRPGHRL